MKSVMHAVALTGLALVAAARTALGEAGEVPRWHPRVLARLPASVGIPGCLGQLDGAGGKELVTYSDDELRAFRWTGKSLTLISKLRVPLRQGREQPTAGDVDGDGRDEILVEGRNGDLLTVALVNGALHVTHRQSLTHSLICASAAYPTRGRGPADLVLLLDDDSGAIAAGEGPGNRLVTYRWSGGRWAQVGRLPFRTKGGFVELLVGDYHPASGIELVAAPKPTAPWDESALFVLWQGGPQGLRKLATFSTGMEPQPYERWVGCGPGLLPGAQSAIVSDTYLHQGKRQVQRAEILSWGGRRPVARLQFSAEPEISGPIPGPTQSAVLCRDTSGSYVLLGP